MYIYIYMSVSFSVSSSSASCVCGFVFLSLASCLLSVCFFRLSPSQSPYLPLCGSCSLSLFTSPYLCLYMYLSASLSLYIYIYIYIYISTYGCHSLCPPLLFSAVSFFCLCSTTVVYLLQRRYSSGRRETAGWRPRRAP